MEDFADPIDIDTAINQLVSMLVARAADVWRVFPSAERRPTPALAGAISALALHEQIAQEVRTHCPTLFRVKLDPTITTYAAAAPVFERLFNTLFNNTNYLRALSIISRFSLVVTMDGVKQLKKSNQLLTEENASSFFQASYGDEVDSISESSDHEDMFMWLYDHLQSIYRLALLPQMRRIRPSGLAFLAAADMPFLVILFRIPERANPLRERFFNIFQKLKVSNVHSWCEAVPIILQWMDIFGKASIAMLETMVERQIALESTWVDELFAFALANEALATIRETSAEARAFFDRFRASKAPTLPLPNPPVDMTPYTVDVESMRRPRECWVLATNGSGGPVSLNPCSGRVKPGNDTYEQLPPEDRSARPNAEYIEKMRMWKDAIQTLLLTELRIQSDDARKIDTFLYAWKLWIIALLDVSKNSRAPQDAEFRVERVQRRMEAWGDHYASLSAEVKNLLGLFLESVRLQPLWSSMHAHLRSNWDNYDWGVVEGDNVGAKYRYMKNFDPFSLIMLPPTEAVTAAAATSSSSSSSSRKKGGRRPGSAGAAASAATATPTPTLSAVLFPGLIGPGNFTLAMAYYA